MRRMIFVGLLLLTGHGYGQFFSAYELLGYCEESAPAHTQMDCLGYLTGVMDSVYFLEDAEFETNVCPPPSPLSRGQLQRAWVNWAREHPEGLGLSAYSSALQAFARTWPCDESSKALQDAFSSPRIR
jgi:hypothetical protein